MSELLFSITVVIILGYYKVIKIKQMKKFREKKHKKFQKNLIRNFKAYSIMLGDGKDDDKCDS